MTTTINYRTNAAGELERITTTVEVVESDPATLESTVLEVVKGLTDIVTNDATEADVAAILENCKNVTKYAAQVGKDSRPVKVGK